MLTLLRRDHADSSCASVRECHPTRTDSIGVLSASFPRCSHDATRKNDGVTELPKVVSPLAFVGKREGVELILVSVEAWPDDIVIRMRGRPSPLTQRLEDDF